MKIPYSFKKCSKCGGWLVSSSINFSRQKNGKYGLTSKCKKCKKRYYEENKKKINDKSKVYYKNNKEKIKKQTKEYYENNKDKVNKQKKIYYEKHKNEKREYDKIYRENHKEEIREYKKEYNQIHKEKVRKNNQKYYLNNKERIDEYQRKYRLDNKEKLKEYNKQYRINNKDILKLKKKEYNSTPKAQALMFNFHAIRRYKEESLGEGVNEEQWKEMMDFFDWKCAYSDESISDKKNRSIDHIVPLNKGGEHEVWNCVPMKKSYNSSKYTRDMLEWYKEQEFFSEERLQKIYEWMKYAKNKWD